MMQPLAFTLLVFYTLCFFAYFIMPFVIYARYLKGPRWFNMIIFLYGPFSLIIYAILRACNGETLIKNKDGAKTLL